MSGTAATAIRDVMVLLSGGIDSTVLAAQAHRGGRLRAALFVNFGQPAHFVERRAALYWTLKHGVPLVEVDLPLHGTMATGIGASGPRVLPGRNLALLGVAINYAGTIGVREVWFGAIADDLLDYPDCGPAFVRALGDLSRAAYGVDVRAPLLGMSKRVVVDHGRALGVNLDETWSCYEPRDRLEPCGDCNSCKLRRRGLSHLQ